MAFLLLGATYLTVVSLYFRNNTSPDICPQSVYLTFFFFLTFLLVFGLSFKVSVKLSNGALFQSVACLL